MTLNNRIGNDHEVNLGIMIDEPKKDQFKAACASRGKTMKEVISAFVDQYTEETSK
jgi:hypothetical protein